MMNIFIMILVILFMGGYFFLSSPSQRIVSHETEYATEVADLRSFTECVVAAHGAAINGVVFDDVCARDMVSRFVCLNSRSAVIECEIVRNKKPEYSFIITAAPVVAPEYYNALMEILERYHADAGALGIYQDGNIVTPNARRPVPSGLVKEMELVDGQLVYMTHYELTAAPNNPNAIAAADITCPAGTIKTFRFSRWQCVGYNPKTNCPGDTIWDSDVMDCVPDESRKPLCADRQTAVMQDDVWECIDPFPDRNCPTGMIARLDYTALEWECVPDPTATTDIKKCDIISRGPTAGRIGGTARVTGNSCTDCEKMVTNPDTCVSTCVPDVSKLSDSKCYPANASSCSGPHRAFYFGFPSRAYAASIDALDGVAVPFDSVHSQNRRFNCLDCGERLINTEKSVPPYVAVCE